MNTIEKSPTRLVIGGWKAGSVVMAAFCLLLPIGFFLTFVQEEPAAIWANLFIAVICGALALRMELWERIVFDTEGGDVSFDQWRLLGRVVRKAPLKPVSRVEVETTSSASNGKPSRRLVLATGDDRTPFTKLFSSRSFKEEQAFLNDWLTEAYGDRWRDAATRLADAPRSAKDDDLPEGVRRIRHPSTGLCVDIPADWSASVSLDWSGPLVIFGMTLIQRYDRPGDKRQPGDGGDWNTLIARGREDSGLKLWIREGPLEKTLDEALEDSWSKQYGLEVLKTTPEVEIGGMRGFSLVRRMEAGGSTHTFGEVSAPVATRQIWLGHGDLHVEVIGTARLDQPDIQTALDAMFASIRLPPTEPEMPEKSVDAHLLES